LQIADSITKTQNDPFQNILDDFFQSTAFTALEVGEIDSVQCLAQYNRKYSIQRLYQIQGQTGIKNIYVKIAKNVYNKSPEDFDAFLNQEFETNLFWYEKLSTYSQFGSIRPLFLSLHYHAIVTEETIGRNLGELIRARLRFSQSPMIQQLLRDHVLSAGKLLHVIQSEYDGEQHYNLHLLVEDIDLRMRAMVVEPSTRFTRELRQAILAFFDKYLPLAEQQNMLTGYMHRDFTMSNLLVKRQKIIVHDFAKIGVGPCLFDVTRFYHHLGLLKYKPVYSNSAVTRLQQAFLEGCNYAESKDDILFNFFILRHYITHYKGLLRDKELSLKSKLYDHWVMKKHLQHIRKIINRTYTH
jgi:hypothetical protein